MVEIGPKTFSLAKNSIYLFEVSDSATLNVINKETGDITATQINPGRKHRVKVYEDTNCELTINDKAHWSHYCAENGLREKGDPIPIEVEEDTVPLTLEEKLLRSFGDKLLAQYGPDSREVETMEDALDFDIDGDGVIASPYEVTNLEPLEPMATESPPNDPPEESREQPPVPPAESREQPPVEPTPEPEQV